MKIIPLLLFLLCAACSNPHSLVTCRGTFQQANPGEWTPDPSELTKDANR